MSKIQEKRQQIATLVDTHAGELEKILLDTRCLGACIEDKLSKLRRGQAAQFTNARRDAMAMIKLMRELRLKLAAIREECNDRQKG